MRRAASTSTTASASTASSTPHLHHHRLLLTTTSTSPPPPPSSPADCAEPKACSIVLRGASKDVLNEVERNLADAMNVVRTIYHDPRLVPGGGASEMTLAHALSEG